MRPPPGDQPTSTAHRGASNREIRKLVSDRAHRLARQAGVVLPGRDVRQVADAFIAAQHAGHADERSLELMVLDRLMRQAPGGRRTSHRQWRLGEAAWRTTS